MWANSIRDAPHPILRHVGRRWTMAKTLPSPSSDKAFEYLKMFNYVVISDEEFAARLPETEFELSFSREGDIYVDGTPFETNVKELYETLALR